MQTNYQFFIRKMELNVTNLKLCVWFAVITQLFLLGRNFYFYGLSFHYYVQLYVAMLVASILVYGVVVTIERQPNTEQRARHLQSALICYYTFTLLWGVLVTLLDQQSSGHVTALLVNILITSTLFISTLKEFIGLHILPLTSFIIGLFYMQPEMRIITAHLLNIIIFYIFAAIAAYSIHKYIE